MIYGNKGGKIGFSSSKSNNCQKKLFTPIQLSLPNVSDIDNHIENNLNSPRKIDNKNQNDINLTFTHRISNKNLTHIPKVQFNIPMKKKNIHLLIIHQIKIIINQIMIFKIKMKKIYWIIIN